MSPSNSPLPYFDALLSLLDDYPALAQAFGRHVHWGYWENPPAKRPNVDEFAEAADRLTHLVGDAAGVAEGQRVLDAGCGFGGTVASLNERFTNLTLHGLNIDPRQLARARRQVLPAPSNEVSWVNANACSLPFADDSFDAVLAVECIFHFPNRTDFFREAYRVLKPGGKLALSDFLSTPCLRLLNWWKSSSSFYGQCDVRFSFQHYRALAQQTGFSVRVERDITRDTLPTYDFLKDLQRQIPFNNISAALDTLFIEYSSRLRLMRYGILGFEKGVVLSHKS